MTLIDYVDLPTMKAYVRQDSTDAVNESLLQDAITSASREVDQRCDRYFGLAASSSEREFDCIANGLLMVDDISTTTGLLFDGVAYDSDSYKLFPRNGIVGGVPGYPYDYVESCSFLKGCTYTVTAVWGWAEVPSPIVEATKMLAAETYIAKNSPTGVVGTSLYGEVRVRERIQIERKLKLYSKYPLGMV